MSGLQRVSASVASLVLFSRCGFGAEPASNELPANLKPFNLENRELWTTGRIHGSPDPPDPFTTQNAFPGLKFFEPLSVGLVPGSQRFGVTGHSWTRSILDNNWRRFQFGRF